ncbi:MAG: alpha/beta hydrolase [Nocardioides sp.]|uniref:alpha/beta hydrolase n=1 Tax=Nocardioides sp. TaxID=35761 RepID=UPI0039E69DB1
MPLHPAAQAFLEAVGSIPQPPDIDVAEFREQLSRLLPQATESAGVANVIDRQIPGGTGQPLNVRIYTPAVQTPGLRRSVPAAVWLHGGSFVRGTLDAFDAQRRAFANLSGFAVVAVDQRLAPEARFPAPVEDADAAWQWTRQHAGELGIDPALIGVAGESSGGNLAAATTLLAAARGEASPAFQILFAPVLDATLAMPTITELGEGYVLTSAQMSWMYDQYAPGVDPRTPLLSPLHAPSLRGLPPAAIVTIEYDPARDEGEAYADRLAAAGVAVHRVRIDGMLHHFPGPAAIATVAELSRRALADISTPGQEPAR